jgi:crotonobetainyl-CoA:carnitine CoA-transferase CaiB-like acyl-CoA transferase
VESADGRWSAIENALEPVLGPVDTLPPVHWTGPASWWGGPLDVEGLARASVVLALRAASVLAEERGQPIGVGTTTARVAGAFDSFSHLRVDGRAPVVWAPMSGWFETADGWIRLHGNYPHHAAALSRTLGVRDRPELERVLRHLHASGTEARIRAGGGIAGALRTASEWRESPMAEALDGAPWIAFSGHGSPQPLPPTTDLPLSGLRVLDLTRVLAGPTCTQLLAQLGAEVLRVDSPGRPEDLDTYLVTGAGKRSATADLRRAEDLRAVHRLLDGADVLVTGYRPGALAAFGLDDASIRTHHRHLVHVSLSAWGTAGPWAQERGFDSIVQAVSGIGHAYGSPDGGGRFRPGALPVQALDVAVGYGMAAAAMALLAARPRRGAGSARLSLAKTADSLLDEGPRADARTLELAVDTTTVSSAHGSLTRTQSPVLLDGSPLALPAPGRYGAADLAWP